MNRPLPNLSIKRVLSISLAAGLAGVGAMWATSLLCEYLRARGVEIPTLVFSLMLIASFLAAINLVGRNLFRDLRIAAELKASRKS
jgi:hypothetical protein